MRKKNSENAKKSSSVKEKKKAVSSSGNNIMSRQYLGYLKKYPLLTKEEEYKLALQVQDGDLEARDLMIKSNLGLVINVAKRFLGRGLAFDDLIMEGNIGLMKAVDKFIAKKGFRFSTYATWWIRQSVERGILNSGRLIRLPIHVSENLFKYSRATKEMISVLEREPSIGEVAERIGMKEKKLEKILGFIGNIYSLDFSFAQNQNQDGEQNISLANIIKADDEGTSSFDILDKIETLKFLNSWLLMLSDTERKIIVLRYGLNHEKPRTLNEIGLIFNLTKERIRQIEVKALKKLKNMAKDAGMNG